jgi:RNA polymerase sigma-70 factor (ECF subfamily)
MPPQELFMAPGFDKSGEFLGLFLKAEPRVYAYIRSQVPHRADAEDILQETASTLWAKFDAFSPGSDFLAWAYQVARFKVRHHYDKQRRRKRLFSQAFVELVANQTEQMSDQLGELQPKLAECMKRLPDADREVVDLCYGSDTTVATVAAELGRPVNTIRSVLKRARRALYECIQRAIGREERR